MTGRTRVDRSIVVAADWDLLFGYGEHGDDYWAARYSSTPETATRQLDDVFASRSIADRVQVRALNEVHEWGPSDHCRILIDVDV